MARQAVGRVALRKSGAFTVSGYAEALDNVDRILDRASAEALKGKFLKAAIVIRDRAKARAPYDDARRRGSHLKDAIFAGPGRKDKPDALVGVNRSAKFGNPVAPHGHLVEFGTKQRYTSGGASRGKAQAQPFMKTAVAESKDAVAAMVLQAMKEAVEGAIR